MALPERLDVIIPAYTETLDHLDDALASLRPYMRPVLVFNGPGCKEIATERFNALTGRTAGTWAFMTEDYVRDGRGGGCHLCHARNYGLEMAASDYVAWLDADDLFLPEVDEVVEAAVQGEGAWGDLLIASNDGEYEHYRDQQHNPRTDFPHIDTVVVARGLAPRFDVWAEHQMELRGPSYERRWWAAMPELVHVPVASAMFRSSWSKKTASTRFKFAGGWIGEGERP